MSIIPDRPKLQEWFRANTPDAEKLRYAELAKDQIIWVRDCLAYLCWNSPQMPRGLGYDEIIATLTVDGTHRSKSVLLPVYRFDLGETVVKIRGNFHDWCVRCNQPMRSEFPEWIVKKDQQGFFEGMSTNWLTPTAFCVSSREEVFTAIGWMLHEGINH